MGIGVFPFKSSIATAGDRVIIYFQSEVDVVKIYLESEVDDG